MIIVHGVLRVFENQRSRALVLMQDMATASQLEAGCVSYEFYASLTNPCQFLLFQEWASVDALQDHFQTEHMEIFLEQLPDILDGEIVTRRYEVRQQQDRSTTSDEVDVESERAPSAPEVSVPKIIH